jgi:hypothetical protein
MVNILANKDGIPFDLDFKSKLEAGTATDRDFANEANRLRWARLYRAVEKLANLD